ncbi:MAG: amidohydrolase [Deltaproteobacteria bacterium]|nr:amidohydrolase [Deltaproteobacteria bacterium]
MADLILYNGIIKTQDAANPWTKAVAVKNSRFVAVGQTEKIKELKTKETRTIDLKGRLVLPGFTDAHFHFYDWSLGRKWIDFSRVSSLEEFLGVLKEAIRKDHVPDLYQGWVLGQHWNESEWPEKRMPTRDDLDKVHATRPILLWRSDLHLAVANSKALEISGIGEDTPVPEHGRIGLDEKGRPNGILQDRAIDLVKDKIPTPKIGQVVEAMREGIPMLHSMGITGLHDLRLMDGSESAPCFRALQTLDMEKALTLRIWTCLSDHVLEEAINIGFQTGMGSDFLRIGHVKLFADGSVGAGTAWLSEPYTDGGTGLPLKEMDEIAHLIKRAESSGLSVAVHAIGDRANHELIKVFVALKGEGYVRRASTVAPHRIEHLQLLHTEDIKQLATLDVMGSVQPLQATDDITLTERRLGSRASLAYRFRDLIEHGVELAFGSDCPVAEPDPLLGIHAAVTRQRADGTPSSGWFPEQRISIEEAVRGYTIQPAKITGRDHFLGSITPGKLADFIVLDQNIFDIPPERIPTTKILLTCIDGKIVYEAWA